MANPFGIGFVIGATVSSTVASAFSTVESKLKATRQALNAASKEAKAFSNAMQLRNRRDALVAQVKASGGADKGALKELRTVAAQYHKAKTAAIAYGGAVGEWGRRHDEARQRLELTHTRLKAFSALQEQAQKRQELRGQMVGTAVGAMALAAPVRAAIDFESGMADAAKTIEGMRDAAGNLAPEYYRMEAAVKSMGRTLPLTHAELAKLFAAGGQQGMTATKDLQEFATMSAHMSVAFGMGTEAAADAIGGYRTALKLSMPDVRSLLDLMNQYANTSSASEKGIADIVRRVGSLGAVGGVAAKPMTALAATLDAMKVSPEVAATGIKNLILAMTAGKAATKSQQRAFASLGIDTKKLAEEMQKDGPAAVLSVLEAVKKLPKAQQLSTMQQIFGKESLASITPLLDNLDLVRKNLIIAGDGSAYAGAMQKEFENRSRTTANALTLFRNRATEVGITVGSVVLPPLVAMLGVVGDWVSSLAELAQRHQALVTILVGVSAGFVALKIATIGVVYAWSVLRTVGLGLSMVWNALRTAAAAYTAATSAGTAASLRATAALAWQKTVAMATAVATRAVAAGQLLLNAAMAANPIGLVIAGVAGLAAGLVWLYTTCAPVREALNSLWTGIQVIGRNLLVALAFPFVMAFDIWKGVASSLLSWMQGVWQAVGDGAAAAWDSIRSAATAVNAAVTAAWSGIGEFFSTQFGAVYTACDTVWTGIGEAINGVWDSVRAKAAALFDWLAAKFEWLGTATNFIASSWNKAKSLVGLGDGEAQAGQTPPPSKRGWYDPRGWFGDDKSPVAATVMPAAAPAMTPNSPVVASKSVGVDMPQVRTPAANVPGQVPGMPSPAATPVAVSANFEFSLNGMPDAVFAQGVVNALRERSSDVEALISGIVNNQMRLAYGG